MRPPNPKSSPCGIIIRRGSFYLPFRREGLLFQTRLLRASGRGALPREKRVIPHRRMRSGKNGKQPPERAKGLVKETASPLPCFFRESAPADDYGKWITLPFARRFRPAAGKGSSCRPVGRGRSLPCRRRRKGRRRKIWQTGILPQRNGSRRRL